MLITQVSVCPQPNIQGKWTIDHYLPPYSCPKWCEDPTDVQSYIFHKERQTSREIIRVVGESTDRDENDVYDLKSITILKLKEEFQESCILLSGQEAELILCLTNALMLDHNIGEIVIRLYVVLSSVIL